MYAVARRTFVARRKFFELGFNDRFRGGEHELLPVCVRHWRYWNCPDVVTWSQKVIYSYVIVLIVHDVIYYVSCILVNWVGVSAGHIDFCVL